MNKPIIIEAYNANEAFVKLLHTVAKEGVETAPRGQKILEAMNVTVVIENPTDRYVKSVMATSPKYLGYEMIYYLGNRNDLEGIGFQAPFGNKISDDGKTIRSAYGFLLREKYGFDQIQYVIDMLKKDPDSRKAVAQFKVPYEKMDSLDNICTLGLIFNIRDGQLHMTSIMRGNDIVLGFRYNVFFFSLIQEMIAKELNVPVGRMTHQVVSMHVYEKHFPLLKEAFYALDESHRLNSETHIHKPHEYSPSNDYKYLTGVDAIGDYNVVPKYSDLQDEMNGDFKDDKSIFKKLYELSKIDVEVGKRAKVHYGQARSTDGLQKEIK